jgi:hypothetical protein
MYSNLALSDEASAKADGRTGLEQQSYNPSFDLTGPGIPFLFTIINMVLART